MTYIIIGGEGFIGGKIQATISAGVAAQSYDIKSQLDILDTDTLLKKAETVLSSTTSSQTDGFFGFFHCAALISVSESIEKPDDYYKTNVLGTKAIIEVAKMLAAQNVPVGIVFSSSAAVYGDTSGTVDEDASLKAKSPYAQNKIDGEQLLREATEPSLSAIALRYFNVYGPGQSAQYAGVITAFIRNALQNKDLVIYGDGEQTRDFIFVEDVARANVLAMNYLKNKHNEKGQLAGEHSRIREGYFNVFNIATGTSVSINTLAKTIIRLTNSSSQIVHTPARAGDILHSCAYAEKAKRVLGFVPKVSLEEGLMKTIEYYRNT